MGPSTPNSLIAMPRLPWEGAPPFVPGAESGVTNVAAFEKRIRGGVPLSRLSEDSLAQVLCEAGQDFKRGRHAPMVLRMDATQHPLVARVAHLKLLHCQIDNVLNLLLLVGGDVLQHGGTFA